MGRGIAGRPGKILTLCAFIAEHETEITADLLAAGFHLYDLGDRLSWWEFECWLKHLTSGALVDKLRALAAEAEAEERRQALPEDERPVGTAADAMPTDEMAEWLGWSLKGGAVLGN